MRAAPATGAACPGLHKKPGIAGAPRRSGNHRTTARSPDRENLLTGPENFPGTFRLRSGSVLSPNVANPEKAYLAYASMLDGTPLEVTPHSAKASGREIR